MKRFEQAYLALYGDTPTLSERQRIQTMATVLNTTVDDDFLIILSMISKDIYTMSLTRRKFTEEAAELSATAKCWASNASKHSETFREQAADAWKLYRLSQDRVARDLRWWRWALLGIGVLLLAGLAAILWQQQTIGRLINSQASSEVRIAGLVEAREAQRTAEGNRRGQASAEALEHRVFTTVAETIAQRLSERLAASEAQKPVVLELIKAEEVVPGILKFAASSDARQLFKTNKAAPRMIEFATSTEGLAMYRMSERNSFSACPQRSVIGNQERCTFIKP